MNALKVYQKGKGERFFENNFLSVVQRSSCWSSRPGARWCHGRRPYHHPTSNTSRGSSGWRGYHSHHRNVLQTRRARTRNDTQRNDADFARTSDSSGVSLLWIYSFLGSALIVLPNATHAATTEPLEDPKHSADERDPYSPESLPEHDEQTTCFLCRTNRHGPCRPFWRPLEHCVKDQTSRSRDDDDDDDDDDDSSTDRDGTSICDRYVRPFEECWSRHAALYLLISHSVTKDMMVDPIERDNETRVVNRFRPVIDWTGYREFCRCRRPEERKESERVNAAAKAAPAPGSEASPLWERFDQRQLEPSIVTVTSQIPIKYKYLEAKPKKRSNHKPGTHSQPIELNFRVAYALDQDGNVIGYTEYSDKDSRESPESGDEHASKKLLISLLPGYTESLQIKVLYADGQHNVLISTPCISLTKKAKMFDDNHKLK